MNAFLNRPLFTGSALIVAVLLCLILYSPAIIAPLTRCLTQHRRPAC